MELWDKVGVGEGVRGARGRGQMLSSQELILEQPMVD